MGALAMGRMRIAAAAACVLLLAAGTACGERKEPTGPLVPLYPVTVQGAGERPAIVSSIPHRIVPLGAGPRRILRALGLQARTITVDDSLVGLPLVGAIRRARPDLVVASSNTDPLDLARARASTHAQVYVEPSSSIDDVVGAIGDIGLLTGAPVVARKLTGQIEREREQVVDRLRGSANVGVFIDTGDFGTVSSRSLLGDLVHEAHGDSVAGPSPEPGPFPLPRLRQLDPGAYIATSGSGRMLADLRASPATKKLRAVRARRFGVVSNAATIPGPAVGRGLAEVARILHPDAFR
jgi:ABC-type Fe3+-hydroxamate transport system substrate-binding protein